MILPMTRKKIVEVEKQIIRDFSYESGTAYTMPLEFSEPKKVKGPVFRVSANVVAVGDKYYPTAVFSGNMHDGYNGKILVLNFEYDSLGVPFGNGDGGIMYGLKYPNANVKKLEELVEKMYFDINTNELTYSMPEGVTEEKQKGN